MVEFAAHEHSVSWKNKFQPSLSIDHKLESSLITKNFNIMNMHDSHSQLLPCVGDQQQTETAVHVKETVHTG